MTSARLADQIAAQQKLLDDYNRKGSNVMTTKTKPETCYVFIFGAKPGERVGIIKRGESGYYLTDFDSATASEDIVKQCVANLNKRLGVDETEALAMEIGSMCGWHVPGADAAQLRKDVNGSAVLA